MMSEPSLFAQQIMSAIEAGEEVLLSERETHDRLTEYENRVIQRAAAKRGYTVWMNPASLATKFEPPTLTPSPASK